MNNKIAELNQKEINTVAGGFFWFSIGALSTVYFMASSPAGNKIILTFMKNIVKLLGEMLRK